MRRWWGAAVFLLWAPVAQAQLAVNCVNCSTLPQQLLDYLRQAQQLQQEIQTAVNTLNFYVNAVQNTVNLPFSIYRDITGDINQIQGLISQATMLAGYSKQMLTNLGSPTGYPDSLIGNWQARITQENQALSLAISQAARVLDTQGPQLSQNAATLTSLQQEAMSDDGRQKTLQTIAGTNATIGQMVQTNQQTIAATNQAQLTYYTAQADRQLLLDGYNDLMFTSAIAADCAALVQLGSAAPAECAGGTTTPTALAASSGLSSTVNNASVTAPTGTVSETTTPIPASQLNP